jgi:hypothetical protein
MDSSFDRFTKMIAGDVSRRDALRHMGGGVAATMVALFGLADRSSADGKSGGNGACARFCNDTLPPGPARGRCISDAAHGQGLCYQCGPAAPAGHGDVCRAGTAAAVCCLPGAACCGNTVCADLNTDVNNCGSCGNVCTPPANARPICTDGGCDYVCNPGYVDVNGTCYKVGTCSQPVECFNQVGFCGGSSDPMCICLPTAEGTTDCAQLRGFCFNCTSSAQCEAMNPAFPLCVTVGRGCCTGGISARACVARCA